MKFYTFNPNEIFTKTTEKLLKFLRKQKKSFFSLEFKIFVDFYLVIIPVYLPTHSCSHRRPIIQIHGTIVENLITVP